MSTDAVRAALAELVRNFPTDTDLIEAGWLPHEIDAAMNASDWVWLPATACTQGLELRHC